MSAHLLRSELDFARLKSESMPMHLHRSRLFFALATLTLAACAGSAPAPSAPGATTPPSEETASPERAAAPLKAPGEATIGDRTTCPTSGEEFTVTANSPKVEHEGKTYYFCCSGCDAKFAREPEKYLKKKKPDA